LTETRLSCLIDISHSLFRVCFL